MKNWLTWVVGLSVFFVLLTVAILVASFYCGTQKPP
jgi:hypothetical protein